MAVRQPLSRLPSEPSSAAVLRGCKPWYKGLVTPYADWCRFLPTLEPPTTLAPLPSASASAKMHSRALLQDNPGEINNALTDPTFAKFRATLAASLSVAVLTGAGVSAASGIPTFRGAGGLWRTWSATELATPEAFFSDPGLVWEFYHYRREVVAKAKPNAGHVALAQLQQWCRDQGKGFTLITQNIDRLHQAAGSTEVVELHGSLWLTRCTHCHQVLENRDMPICPALHGKGCPDPQTKGPSIPPEDLPHCHSCNGLLRPHVVWFGENLERSILERANKAVEECDFFIVVGTSSVVYPAAGFARLAKALGAAVAEFNMEETDNSSIAQCQFHGDSAKLLPLALSGILPPLEKM